MKIIGFKIKKVSAERKSDIKGKLEIKSGLNIDDITKEEIQISEKPSMKFDFSYTVDYSPDIAKIEINGSIIALDDSNESKEILKDWKKKKFNHAIKLPLFNFIMDKCNLKALQLEEEIGLPFHIPMPKLAPNPNTNPKNRDSKNSKNPENYTG